MTTGKESHKSGENFTRKTVGWLATIVALAVALPAMALNCTWNGSASDSWSTEGVWSSVPTGSGDTVIVPDGATLPVGDADIDLAKTVGAIQLLGTDSQVIYAITTAAVSHPTISGKGKLIMRGTGTLELENRADVLTCDRVAVENGILRLPSSGTGRNLTFGKVDVGENGILETSNVGWTTIKELTGSGVVTNNVNATDNQNLIVSGSTTWHEFSGRVTGRITFFPVGYIKLTGTHNNPNGGVTLATERGSHVGVLSFDASSGASSIGTGNILMGNVFSSKIGGCYLWYLGGGETVTRNITAHVANTIPFTFDGGETGGLILAGTITSGATKGGGRPGGTYEPFVFAGSHATPCELTGGFAENARTEDNVTVTCASSLAKRGSGTWIFRHNANRENRGLVIVEEGTLQFESIAETNVVCSLGIGTLPLAEGYIDNLTNTLATTDCVLPYNILLGGASNPVMEYIGAEKGYCRTRPIAVTGRGTLKGSLDWAGAVAADPAQGGTLVLDGAATDSVLRDVDGIAIEKAGTGTWKLAGAQNPTGIKVARGELQVAAPVYSWFKLTIEGHSKKQDSNVCIQEIGFWDASGHRIAVSNIVRAASCTQNALKPGTACWDQSMSEFSGRYVDMAFDDVVGSEPLTANAGTSVYPTVEEPSKWFSLTMRLPEGSPKVVKYDLCDANGGDRSIVAWKLEGSVDGTTWVHLDERRGMTPQANKWFSDGTALTATQFDQGSPQGFTIASAPDGATSLADTSSIEVASGAVLRAVGDAPVTISSLTLGASNGTLSGFALAETGVVNVPARGSVFYPVTLTGLSGLENLKNWTVKLNGVALDGYKAIPVDGGVLIKPNGFVVIIR